MPCSEQRNPMPFGVLHEHHIGCMTTKQHSHLQSVTHLVLNLGSAMEPIQALQMEQSKGLELVQVLLQTKQNYAGLAAVKRAAG